MHAICIHLSTGLVVWTIAGSTREVEHAIEGGREISVSDDRPEHAFADFMPARIKTRHVVAIVLFPEVEG